MKQEPQETRPSGRKKVLFVITKSNWGGAQRYVYDLATNLDRNEFEPVVALGGSGYQGATEGAGILKNKLQPGIRTIFIKSLIRDISFMREFLAVKELVQIIKTERPDIVHLNSSKAGVLGAIAARLATHTTVIFTVHGLPSDENRGFFSRTVIALTTWMTFLLSDVVITVSKDNYERVQRNLFCRNRTRLIHNGIGVDPFFTREDALDRLSVDTVAPETVWIGSIAELTTNKNLSRGLEIFAYAARQNPHLRYIIIGDGEERAKLLQKVQELNLTGRVDFAGYVSNASRYLNAFDIFFLPSLKEGLPYVLLEAGQAGRAVVASKVGGIPDIIEDGTSGLLIDPRNSEISSQALVRLSQDASLRESLGSHLKSYVNADFSLENMVKMTTALYLT